MECSPTQQYISSTGNDVTRRKSANVLEADDGQWSTADSNMATHSKVTENSRRRTKQSAIHEEDDADWRSAGSSDTDEAINVDCHRHN